MLRPQRAEAENSVSFLGRIKRASLAPNSRSSNAATTSSALPTSRNGAPAPSTWTPSALEELLISADIGVAATDRIINAVKSRTRDGASLRDLVKRGFATSSPQWTHRCPSRSARSHPDRRRERDRQDDDGGEAGEPAEEQKAKKPLICAADVSGGGRRTARNLRLAPAWI
jgi:hypothetical protein